MSGVLQAFLVFMGIIVTAGTGALVQIYLDSRKEKREGNKQKGDYAIDLQNLLEKETQNHLDVIERMEKQKQYYEDRLAAQKLEYDKRIAALEAQLAQNTNEYEMRTIIRMVGSNATIKEQSINMVSR